MNEQLLMKLYKIIKTVIKDKNLPACLLENISSCQFPSMTYLNRQKEKNNLLKNFSILILSYYKLQYNFTNFNYSSLEENFQKLITP